MKILIILILFNIMGAGAAEKGRAYKYLSKNASEQDALYQHNEYEQIISGGLAFLVGNIGYFTTPSETLKIAYSGVQTVGILSVGQGIYEYYKPNFDKDLLKLLKQKKLTRSTLADGFLDILGKEERAKRLSLMYGSSLLALQYVTNAYLSDTPGDIRDIYIFMAGINVIVFNYAYFSRDKYEQYLDEKGNTAWHMAPGFTSNALLVGIHRKF